MNRNRVEPWKPRHRRGSDAWIVVLLVIAAIIGGGYYLIERRLGNNIFARPASDKPLKQTRTPLPTVTPTRSVDDFIGLAQQSYRAGDYRAAISHYDQAFRRRPADLSLPTQAARLTVFIGQPAKAEVRIRKVLQSNPAYPPALAVLCLALEWQRKLPEAIHECESAIAADPKLAPAYAYLAEALIDTNEWQTIQRAKEMSAKAIELDAQNEDVIKNDAYVAELSQDLNGAAQEYEQALSINENMPHVLVDLGRVYGKLGYVTQAISTTARALDLDPQYSEGYNRLGLLYESQGEHEKSIKNYTQAIELEPMRIEYITNRARVRFLARKYPSSAEDYQRAITTSQQLSTTITALDYLNYGFALRWDVRCDEAKKAWDIAVAMAPGNDYIIGNAEAGYKICAEQ